MSQVPIRYAKKVAKNKAYNEVKPFIKHKTTARESISLLKKTIKDKKARKTK